MHSLSAELQRLFGRPGQDLPDPLPEAGLTLDLVSPDERVWTMVIGVAPAAGWAPVATLCEGVVNALDLPVPAVSVAGGAGFRVWFSLADPVPLARAEAFLAGLRARFLAGLPAAQLSLLPSAGARSVPLAPGREAGNGRWTAFIDPAMGGMFADETWLDMAPSPERQAELLAGFKSIGAADFLRVLSVLEPGGAMVPAPGGPVTGLVMEAPARPGATPSAGLAVGSGFVDPKSFLLAVMNDPGANAELRIDAAKALLPYFP
ncbi:hypothetical protein [Zoogloea sp.]|jgi:hypothetical protein|uniref:hypothetical protein n=1 Tax=Zoogloea sp. TaxID=49181 RepID=UPI0037D9D6BE